MKADELQDSPVLTPEQVLHLRGVSLDDFHLLPTPALTPREPSVASTASAC